MPIASTTAYNLPHTFLVRVDLVFHAVDSRNELKEGWGKKVN